MSEKPNIALVVLDTLRKDAFDEYFDWLPGKRYENAWMNSHWTVPVHGSIFTGQTPEECGIKANSRKFDTETPLLAEKLASDGYRTRAFSANPNIIPEFGCDKGFDQFEVKGEGERIEQNIVPWKSFAAQSDDAGIVRYLKALRKCFSREYRTIPSLIEGARIKMGRYEYDSNAFRKYYQSQEFEETGEFLFVNLMEAHAPYNTPDGYSTPEVEIEGLHHTVEGPRDDPEDIRTAYESAVEFLSDQYRDIFRDLQSEFDIIITMGDHGELLGEHGKWEHLCGIEPELVHVPFTLFGADMNVKEEFIDSTTVHDIILGLSKGETSVSGKEEVLTEYHGLQDTNFNHLAESVSREVALKFRMAGAGRVNNSSYVYDPIPDTSELPESAKKLRQTINVLESDVEVTQETMERLEELGYA